MLLFDTKVERALPKIEGPFGVVFLDPPYAEVRSPAFAGILEKAGALLLPGAALVLEHASDGRGARDHGPRARSKSPLRRHDAQPLPRSRAVTRKKRGAST